MTMTAPSAPRGLRRASRSAAAAVCGTRSAGDTALWTGMVSTVLAIRSVPDAGIEQRVGEIDEQVGGDDDDDDEQVDALDDRVVALENRFHQELSHPGNPEDGLDDHGAAGDLRHLEPEHGDDRDEGV